MRSYNEDKLLNNIYIKTSGNYSKIIDNNTQKELIIKTPLVTCPFGIEENVYIKNNLESKSYIFKIDLENLIFKDNIEKFENYICNLISKLI